MALVETNIKLILILFLAPSFGAVKFVSSAGVIIFMKVTCEPFTVARVKI